ncbi:MAG: MerR family transcriptional regulator [Crocinitomicaceae bacterium]|jgi:DNA-binding transcriptional MerR regulator
MGEYKIRDLEQLTGIKAHTIRIWEQRYNLLEPSRSNTSVRYYSDEELAFILKVALLNKNGVKISRIAEMTYEEVNSRVEKLNLNNNSQDHYFEVLLLGLVQMDERLFSETLNELISEYGLFHTFDKFLLTFLDKIGIMWIVGSINPAQEHFVTHLIRQKIIVETDKIPITESDDVYFIYLPENEWHELGVLFYNYVLRKERKKTIYLGQSLPLDSLFQCINKYKPSVLVTSVVTAMDDKSMEKYFSEIKKAYPDILIYAGGYKLIHIEADLEKYVTKIKDSTSFDLMINKKTKN